MPVNDPVMIVGLFQNVNAQEVFKWRDMGGQVWALNDYYMRHSWLSRTLDAVWQVHQPEDIFPDYEHLRWLGEWRKVYRAQGCPVYSMWPDVYCAGESRYDLHVVKMESMPEGYYFKSSIDYILAHCEAVGVHHVEIRGVFMLDERNQAERVFQLRGLVENICTARRRGITIGTQKWQGEDLFELWDKAAPPIDETDIKLHYHTLRHPLNMAKISLIEEQLNAVTY